jgi:hypothetical protein
LLLSPELKQTVINNIQNVSGWRTKRKIVVIESDDWGSIRMPSKEVYELLTKAGLRVDKDPYNKYDSFSSEDDLTKLFEVLSAFKDINSNSPVITANCVLVNPDFDKIRASNFREYHFELFTETLKRYPGHINSFSLWNEGIAKKLIYPQSHGREHVNVKRWMNALQENKKDVRLAFDCGLFGIITNSSKESRNSYMASLDFDNEEEKPDLKLIVEEGLKLFEQVYGFKSASFIAPCYTWNSSIEPVLFDAGVKYLKGNFIQAEPAHSPGKIRYKRRYHYIGQQNIHKQYYLTRNCFFEPSQNENFDWVNYCLQGINNAFKWHKPASISMHRLNLIGFIDPSNRDRNLPKLKTLFSEILKKWQDVEFMNSVQLGDLISQQNFLN